MIKRDKIKELSRQAYIDYITALLQCGEYQEVIYTPYGLSIKEIIKRASYHLKAYDELGSFYYEMFGVNFQQYVYEKHIWSELINKWIGHYTYIRRRYGK